MATTVSVAWGHVQAKLRNNYNTIRSTNYLWQAPTDQELTAFPTDFLGATRYVPTQHPSFLPFFDWTSLTETATATVGAAATSTATTQISHSGSTSTLTDGVIGPVPEQFIGVFGIVDFAINGKFGLDEGKVRGHCQ